MGAAMHEEVSLEKPWMDFLIISMRVKTKCFPLELEYTPHMFQHCCGNLTGVSIDSIIKV